MNLWIKKGGSPASDSQPYVRCETWFPKPVKMHNLLKTVSNLHTMPHLFTYFFLQVYHPKHVLMFDKNLEDVYAEPLPREPSCNCVSFNYSRQKAQYGISGREFYEKSLMFYSDGVLYRYTSSMPNSGLGEP